MASKTAATEMKRLMRNNSMGRKRKNANENHGTTKSAAVLFGDEAPKAKKIIKK
ncbi:MAG: hypothetical protein KF767_18695 [Bdellovibrionaceae bacterium]|jgi:hypothetical protein|nr:hypothetical protein [Pseudobdellovibrionaceae bacterium]